MIAIVLLCTYIPKLQKKIEVLHQEQLSQERRCSEEIKRQVDEKAETFTKLLEARDETRRIDIREQEERCKRERDADTNKNERLISELKAQIELMRKNQ